MTEEIRTKNRSREKPEGASHPRRRKRLIVAGSVVLAVLLFLVLPGYLAMQPRFFDRFPSLDAKYDLWSKSTHVEAGCQTCHVPPNVFAQASYRVRMVGEFYVSLFYRSRQPKLFDRPRNSACLSCHDDLRNVSPKGDLQIPHRAHVSVLKMDCVDCHNYLVHEMNPSGKQAPAMTDCLRCHDGDRAKNTCTACHTEKAVPESHRAANWTIVHAEKAKDPNCNSCHKWTDKWCSDCHARRPGSHGNDWRAVHGLQVEKHRNCEACHVASFCIRCHGEVPQLNFDPTLKLAQ